MQPARFHIRNDITPGGCLVQLEGAIDEHFDGRPLAEVPGKVMIFDFERVRRITSFGVNYWLAALQNLRAEYYGFINCRPAAISQFNMVVSFGGAGQLITLYAPYVCQGCDREIDHLIDLRAQHAEVASGKPPTVRCPACKAETIFDDVPESYFSYARIRPVPRVPPIAAALIAGTTASPVVLRGSAPLAKEANNPASPRPVRDDTFKTMPWVRPGVLHSRIRVPSLNARILLLDGDVEHSERISQVLRAAAVVESKTSLAEVTSSTGWDLLLVNYNTLSPGDRERLIKTFASLRQQGRLVIYSEGAGHDELTTLIDTLGLTNILARNGEVDPEELYVTVQKLLSQDIFGVDKYFSWGVRSLEVQLKNSKDKEKILEAAGGFAAGVGVQTRLSDLFCLVVEELVTNAIYDAPVDAQGRHRFSHLSRSQEVALDPHESITITLCCDGRRLGLSVSDPFGSLMPKKVADYLVKCFRKGDNQVDRKEGGAGLGLYYVFESLSHMIVNVQRGSRTELIGLLDIRGTYKDFVSRGKSFNIFTTT
jgi:signal transduction histidine kinase